MKKKKHPTEIRALLRYIGGLVGDLHACCVEMERLKAQHRQVHSPNLPLPMGILRGFMIILTSLGNRFCGRLVSFCPRVAASDHINQ